MYEYKLKSLTESYGIEQTKTTLTEAIQQKKIDPYAIRFPALVEAFLGRDYFSAERKLKAISQGRTHLLEASEANDASAFSNITGQLLVTIIKEKYDSPEFIGSQLVRTVPNPGANLKEHKVPYLSDVLTKGETLSQGETYPYAQFAEIWYEMPAPIKSGQLCAVTMEALFSDLTGQIGRAHV